jgi:molecular chaperone GrpE
MPIEDAGRDEGPLTADEWAEVTLGLLRPAARLRDQLKQREGQVREERAGLLRQLLEVLDSFDDYFANIAAKEAEAGEQTKVWLGYFRRVQRKLKRVVEGEGVTEIETLGQKAVPGLHTVEETRPAPGLEDDVILEERRKGYLWRGEPLRSAVVVAVKNDESAR